MEKPMTKARAPVGGTFQFSYEGKLSDPIPYNADVPTINRACDILAGRVAKRARDRAQGRRQGSAKSHGARQREGTMRSRRHGDKIIDTYEVRCDDTDIRYTCDVRMVKRENSTTFRIVCELLELSVQGEDIDKLKKEMKLEVNEKGKLPWSRWFQIQVTHLSGKDSLGDDQPEQRGIRIDLARVLRSGVGEPGERHRPANLNWTPSQHSWTSQGPPDSGPADADNDNWNRNDPTMTSLIEATPEVEKAIGQIMARISELYDRLAGILSPAQVSASVKSILAGVPVLALPAPPPAPKKRARARK